MTHTDAYKPELAKYCDHTVLKAYTTQDVIERFCREAIDYNLASVCVNTVHVPYVKSLLAGTPVKVCAVVGFPLGANLPDVKAYESRRAMEEGADEIDMVMNIGAMRDGNQDLVYQDMKAVVDAVSDDTIVKVIIETCYLTKEQIVTACQIATRAGVDFVKTSTGFGTDGAKEEDLRLMRSSISDGMKVKASTGVNTQEDALRMIAAGADRLGLSSSIQVIEGDASLVTASASNKI